MHSLQYLLLFVSAVNSLHSAADLNYIVQVIGEDFTRFFRVGKKLQDGQHFIVVGAQEVVGSPGRWTKVGAPIVLKIQSTNKGEPVYFSSVKAIENEILGYKYLAEEYSKAKDAATKRNIAFEEIRLPIMHFEGKCQAFKDDLFTDYKLFGVELLGDSLHVVFFEKRPEQITVKVLLGYGIQLMKYFKFLKSINMTHQDVKPPNFVLDPSDPTIVLPIDLAYAKFPNSKTMLIGPTAYSSLNVDNRGVSSPLDDAEAFIIIFVKIIVGWLSWEFKGLSPEEQKFCKENFAQFILEKLAHLNIFGNLPQLLVDMLEKIRKNKSCDYNLIQDFNRIVLKHGEEVIKLSPLLTQ